MGGFGFEGFFFDWEKCGSLTVYNQKYDFVAICI